jgi:hypothetical protein
MHMQQQQRLQERSRLSFLILASLVDESKRATTLHEAVIQAGGLLIEPGAFSRVVARMERRGRIAQVSDHRSGNAGFTGP